jgi:hypothetical protein
MPPTSVPDAPSPATGARSKSQFCSGTEVKPKLASPTAIACARRRQRRL